MMVKIPKYIKQMCRPITLENIHKFILALGQTGWSIFDNINDTNLAHITFNSKFLKIYCINLPIIHINLLKFIQKIANHA